MTRAKNGYRWLVVAIFLAFMLLHQTDKELINPLIPDIIESLGSPRLRWAA